MFLISAYHGLFHLTFLFLFFSSFALLHTLKTDSSKSLSLCNLIMEETPDSGLAEEIQRSQIDLGALMWGPDASTESVSQELPQGGSQEDSACVSEAERDVGLSTGMLPSADWHTVAEEGEHVLGPAPLCRSEQLLPEPVPGAEFAMAASVELEQPYDLPDSEIPAMETGGLVQESQEAVKKSEEEEDQQKIQDSIWAGVETCEKVDTGAVGIKALEGTEEFEEKVHESTGNRVVDLCKTTGKQDQETLKISEEGTRKDLSAGCEESLKTSEECLEETDILEKEMESVDMIDEFSDRDQGLGDRIQVVINNCMVTGGSGARPAIHTGVLNLPLQTDSVSNTEDASSEGWGLAGKDREKNLLDPPDHDVTYPSAQGSADAEEIQWEAVLHAPGGDQDENQAVVLSVKHEATAQTRTNLSCALGTNANRRDWCLCQAGDPFIEGAENTMTGNCSHTINLPRIAKTDSWGTDPGQIWQPSLDSGATNIDTLECSGIPDSQASGFASCLDSINHWPIRDTRGLDNCWEHLDTFGSKKGMEVDLLGDVGGEQATASCWEQNQEIIRPLVLGASQNASIECPQDSDTNNSDLSEDEIANQRYGLLYQEIEADKEEVLTPVCSID